MINKMIIKFTGIPNKAQKMFPQVKNVFINTGDSLALITVVVLIEILAPITSDVVLIDMLLTITISSTSFFTDDSNL